jgi:glycosyltransferase involved in cell wall biosynthesis
MAEEGSVKENKPRLLIATDNFLPRWDGISRFLAEIIPRLKGRYDIVVIAPDFGPTPAERSTSFRLVKVPTSRFQVGDFKIPKPDHEKIRQEVASCNLVFSQTIGPVGYAVIKEARKQGKKVVSFIHSIEWELVTMALGINIFRRQSYWLAKSFIRRIYENADILIFPSQGISEIFAWHQIDTPKEVIHLGVDTKKFLPPEDKAEAKKKVGIDPSLFVIGYHGRLAREKDLMTLLRAFIIVKKQNPKAALLVVGDGLESIKKKLSSVRGVVMPGATNNVVQYLQALDVFCLPSLTETTSLTTLEAMACGVPVVVNRVGFVKDYIIERKTGLFFKGKDSYDLAKQLMPLIRDDEMRKKLGSNGRKFVEKYFDWDLTAKGLDAVFERIISGKDA